MTALSRNQTVFGLVLGLCYAWLVFQAIGYSAAVWLPDPLTALPLDKNSRILIAGDLLHLLAVSVAALPVALMLRGLMPLVSTRAALVVGGVPVLLAVAQIVGSIAGNAVSLDLVSLALMAWSLAKVLLAPLLLVIIISWVAPPNKPVHPTQPAAATGDR